MKRIKQILVTLCLCLLLPLQVNATDVEDELISQFNFTEIDEMLEQDGQIEMCCHFCNKKYIFTDL